MTTKTTTTIIAISLALALAACDTQDHEALIRQCFRPCNGGADLCLSPCPKLAPAPPPKPRDPEEPPNCKNPDWPC